MQLRSYQWFLTLISISAFSLTVLPAGEPHDPPLGDAVSSSDHGAGIASLGVLSRSDDPVYYAVLAVITAEGSNAKRSENQGDAGDESGPPAPVDGGKGGTIEVYSGVRADTGDGSDGSLESSTTLGPGEYHYHHVAKSNMFDMEDPYLEIKVQGHVVIRCQTMFNAFIVAADDEGEPPSVEIYAGPPVMPQVNGWFGPMPYPHRNHQIYCELDAPSADRPIEGGTVVFHTTQFGAISLGGDVEGGNGIAGGNGGDGGTIRVFANLSSVASNCTASGGNGADAASPETDGGHGGDGGTILVKAASDPDFTPDPDSPCAVLNGIAVATGGDGGDGGYGRPGEAGVFGETEPETGQESDGSGTDGAPGGTGGNGGAGGIVRYEGNVIETTTPNLKGGSGGGGGKGGVGGDGAYGSGGARGQDNYGGVGGGGERGRSGGRGGNGATGGSGGDGGIGGYFICIGDSSDLAPLFTCDGGRGGRGGTGGKGGDGRMGGSGGAGGSGMFGGDGGDGAKGGDGADGGAGGDGGKGGMAGRTVYRTAGDSRTGASVPGSAGPAGLPLLPGDAVEEAADGEAGDGGHGGDGGQGGGGGSGASGGYSTDPSASRGQSGDGADGGDGGKGLSGGKGLIGGDGGAGGKGGRGGGSDGVAGNGGNGGQGGDGGDSASGATEDDTEIDNEDVGEQDDRQPGEGGDGGEGGEAGYSYSEPASAGQPGQAGEPGSSGAYVAAETRTGTLSVPADLPPGARPVVVFVPGIAASVLRGTGDDGEEILWPTSSPTDIRSLSLGATGAPDIQAVDILRETHMSDFFDIWVPSWVDSLVDDFYQPLMDFFVEEGFVEFDLEGTPGRLTSDYMLTLDPKPTLFPFPYDWRRDNADSAEELRHYIDRIRQLHPDHDIYIVAHSMGGLVARRCILDNADGIGKLMTIGSPLWGAPVAIYRMIMGEFFGDEISKDVLDWFNNEAVRETIRTMPSFHQLLPSSTYLANGGSPVLTDKDWDANHDSLLGDYSETQYWDFVDDLASPFLPITIASPSVNNLVFHSGGQDDWSEDSSQIWYYHIIGDMFSLSWNQVRYQTTVRVVAQEEILIDPYAGPIPINQYNEIKGPGDGTVPILSAQRLREFYAPEPRTISKVISGLKEATEHTNLTKNAEVHEEIRDFFYGYINPYEQEEQSVLSMSTIGQPEAESTYRISVRGCGFVDVIDGSGNQNTRVAELAALTVPGVAIEYGGDDLWVDLECGIDQELIVGGPEQALAIEVKVTTVDGAGAIRSLRRFRFQPARGGWQLHLQPGSAPVVAVDSDGDGAFAPAEALLPSHQSNDDSVDGAPPVIAQEIHIAGNKIRIAFEGSDLPNGDSAAVRCYTGNSPATNYTSPIEIGFDEAARVRAFAEDPSGNTSGLLETAVIPGTSGREGSVQLALRMPVAQGYVLEESPSAGGPWRPSLVEPSHSGHSQVTELLIAPGDTKSYRIRSAQAILPEEEP